MTTRQAPCASCTRVTTHRIIAREDRSNEEGRDIYYFLACAGCDTVSMANVFNFGGIGDDEAYYYPSPISRKLPSWSWQLTWAGADESKLGQLFNEIYQAVQGKQYRLASMGIRAFLEQLMIIKVGDRGTFDKNLDAFLADGYISKIQRSAISHILDSGHAVIHRMHKPTEEDLNIALDITESVTAAIYFHEDAAKSVSARVPTRNVKT